MQHPRNMLLLWTLSGQRTLLAFAFLLFRGMALGQSDEKDTIYYSFYLKSIYFNDRLYTSADTGIFDITTTPGKASKEQGPRRQDDAKFFENGWMLQLHIKRIDHPSSSYIQRQAISIWIKPKNQTTTSMGLESYSNQLNLGSFKKGIHYIIDTLFYTCGNYYFNLREMNKNIRQDSCHVSAAQLINAHPFIVQPREKVDSILRIVDSTIHSSKKIAALNNNLRIEYRDKRWKCTDTATYQIQYWIAKHKEKKYEFNDNGSIDRILLHEHRLKFFFRYCKRSLPYFQLSCGFRIVGRDWDTHILYTKPGS
jgi:hypothetical protein